MISTKWRIEMVIETPESVGDSFLKEIITNIVIEQGFTILKLKNIPLKMKLENRSLKYGK